MSGEVEEGGGGMRKLEKQPIDLQCDLSILQLFWFGLAVPFLQSSAR